jgi:surface antigen Omp85-like protein
MVFRPLKPLLMAALCAAALARPVPAVGQEAAWRPRTVPLIGASYAPDVGVLVGVGVVHTRYAFHALPPSTRLLAEAEYGSAAGSYRAELAGEFRRPLAPTVLTVELRLSGLELVRFYGFGNQTDATQPDSVYRVNQRQSLFAAAATVPLAPRLRLTLGPLVKYAHTHPDTATLLRRTGPYYGAGNFGQIGTRALLELDTRDVPAAPAEGVHLRLVGEWYPGAWDVVSPFGRVSAEASTYVSAGEPASATLALRAGAARVGGTVPFHEMVYVGGETTVRGYAEQRFAGRSGAYANVELRLFVGRVSPGDVGVFGLADAGRVWFPSQPSDTWHAAAGGGVWFAWRHRRADTISLAVATSPERTALYVRAGFMF